VLCSLGVKHDCVSGAACAAVCVCVCVCRSCVRLVRVQALEHPYFSSAPAPAPHGSIPIPVARGRGDAAGGGSGAGEAAASRGFDAGAEGAWGDSEVWEDASARETLGAGKKLDF
jgi:hypothetical protein